MSDWQTYSTKVKLRGFSLKNQYWHAYNYEEYTKAFEKKWEINIKPQFLKDSHIQLHSVAFDMAWVNFGHFE